jgi:hypothetical protein
MLPILFIGLILFVIALISRAVFNFTRDKLLFEKEKDEFLREKYKYLLESTEENVIDIFVVLPKYKSGNWIVEKRVKSGAWPFSDKEEDIEVMQISDKNLTDILQY